MASRLCTLVASLYWQFAISSTAFLGMTFHACHRTMKISFRHQVSPWLLFLVIFHCSGRNTWFEHASKLSTISLLIWHSRWVQPKLKWSRNDVGSPKSTSFMSTFQVGLMFCFFPASLMSSTYTDKNNPFSRCTNKHSQLETFSQSYVNRIFSNCLSHKSPARGWPYRFRSKRNNRIFHNGRWFGPFVLW